MSTAQDDLTARAKIRDAALAVFAEQGEKGATVRGIAARAGVSPALVQHHYATKAGLRAACDAYVLGFLRAEVRAGLDEGRVADPAFAVEALRTGPPVLRYLVRALIDNSPGSAEIFDQVVAISEPYVRVQDPALDRRDKAAVLVAMRLGLAVFHDHLTRTLGVDPFSAEGFARTARLQLEILNPELTDPGVFDQVRGSLGLPHQDQQ